MKPEGKENGARRAVHSPKSKQDTVQDGGQGAWPGGVCEASGSRRWRGERRRCLTWKVVQGRSKGRVGERDEQGQPCLCKAQSTGLSTTRMYARDTCCKLRLGALHLVRLAPRAWDYPRICFQLRIRTPICFPVCPGGGGGRRYEATYPRGRWKSVLGEKESNDHDEARDERKRLQAHGHRSLAACTSAPLPLLRHHGGFSVLSPACRHSPALALYSMYEVHVENEPALP